MPTPPKVKLTYEVTRLLSHPRAEPVEPRNSAIPGIRRGLLAEGWGDESGGPGEAHQPRVLELWDDDNGWLRLRATNMDPPTDTPLLTEARALAVLDWTTRWFDAVPSTPQDRNVEIFVRKP